MLFHRNPWKDPTEGDSNFDTFLDDPVGFFLTKFTGIGREVARYLAEKVLCIDVEDRVSAAEFGRWIKGLPEMIAGRKAIHAIKVERREREREHKWSAKEEKEDLFVKSPVVPQEAVRKATASVLTVTAPSVPAFPINIQDGSQPALTASAPAAPIPIAMAPLLSSLPPPGTSLLETPSALPTPDLSDELKSASTLEENTTPVDSQFESPEVSEAGQNGSQVDGDEADARSLSTHRRRKRGVRKGKAAQAALAAATAGEKPSKEERDALLVELAAASQSLARDLSNVRSVDVNREEDFPPLGTSPAQVAAEKKSKWKELLKASSQANPELAALARRVAERDAGSGGNWSAPAKLQGHPESKKGPFRPAFTTSASSGFTTATAVSSYDQGSSATSSMSAVEEDMEWRRRPIKLATHIEEPDVHAHAAKDGERDRHRRHREKEKRRDESPGRARKAALAAAAIAGGMGPMGTFGAPGSAVKGHERAPVPVHVHRSSRLGQGGKEGHTQATGISIAPITHVPLKAPAQSSASTPSQQAQPTKIMGFDRPSRSAASAMSTTTTSTTTTTAAEYSHSSVPSLSFSATPTIETDMTASRMSIASSDSNGTLRPAPVVHTPEMDSRQDEVRTSSKVSESPNKPKIKGQIQSLAKMLSGLKTKH